MTIVLYAENKEEYDELMFNQRYGMYEGTKIQIRYNKKILGRPRKDRNNAKL